MIKKEWVKPVVTKLDVLMTAMSWDEWNTALDNWLAGFKPLHRDPTGAEWAAWTSTHHYS